MFTRRLFNNIASLMTLQLGNYLLPLILVPYLVRVLGLEVFGTWTFAMAMVIIARTCVSYGFDLTATRKVAVNRDCPDKLSELYQAVVAVRLMIWFSCCAALLVGALLVDYDSEVTALVGTGMLILLGEILFPVWLYQGAETMAMITKIKLASKTANVILVLWFVNGPEDVLLVPLLEAATSMAAGVIALIVAIQRFSLRWTPLRRGRIGSEIREGAAVFLALGSGHAYTTVNVIIVGVVAGPVAVAQFAIAEKIYSAVRGLLGPVVQGLFPGMAIQFERSRVEFRATTLRMALRIAGVLAVVAVVVVATADWLVLLVAGTRDEVAVEILRILGFAMVFALGSFLGPMLVVQGRNRMLMRITMVGGALGLATVWPLVVLFGVSGAALSFLIVQIYNSAALLSVSMRKLAG